MMLLMAVLISVSSAWAADLPEFGQTERQILQVYNESAKEFNLPQVDPAVYCQKYDKDRHLYRSYRLNPFMDILFAYNHDGGKPIRVQISADGEPDTQIQKNYARTFMSFVQLFTPDMNANERETLITKLGILQPDYSTLGRNQVKAGDIYFVFGATAGKILIAVSPMPRR
ncbi:MAG: hypothetical protein V8Q84_04895 [Bilophila sp.]